MSSIITKTAQIHVVSVKIIICVVSVFMLSIFAKCDFDLIFFFFFILKTEEKNICEDFTSSFSTQTCCAVPPALSIKCQMHKMVLTPCVATWDSSIIQTHETQIPEHGVQICARYFQGSWRKALQATAKRDTQQIGQPLPTSAVELCIMWNHHVHAMCFFVYPFDHGLSVVFVKSSEWGSLKSNWEQGATKELGPHSAARSENRQKW